MKGTLTLEDGRTLSVELTEEQAKELEDKKWYWTPEDGDVYYYPDTVPELNRFTRHEFDIANVERGTAFRTSEECQRWIDTQKAMTTIRKYAYWKWGKFVPNWNGSLEKKSCVYYSHAEKRFEVKTFYAINYWCFEYFRKLEHAQEIIEKFEKELKIIFWIQ